MPYRVYICGPTVCPHDDDYVHECFPFGCVPKDFDTEKKYKSATVKQEWDDEMGVFHWPGGCCAAKECVAHRTATSKTARTRIVLQIEPEA